MHAGPSPSRRIASCVRAACSVIVCAALLPPCRHACRVPPCHVQVVRHGGKHVEEKLVDVRARHETPPYDSADSRSGP